MRSATLACVVFIASASAMAQDLDPVRSFEALLEASQKRTESSQPVYFNNYRKLWAKRRFVVSDAKYDIRKTDSLVTPVLGLVTYRLAVSQTELVEAQEHAQALSAFNNASPVSYTISLRYSLKAGVWSFLDGESRGEGSATGKFAITRETLEREPNAIPNVAVRYWLPVL